MLQTLINTAVDAILALKPRKPGRLPHTALNPSRDALEEIRKKFLADLEALNVPDLIPNPEKEWENIIGRAEAAAKWR